MSLLPFVSRGRAVWTDPARKLRTLESFARTEEDGGNDIAAALAVLADPELRKHLERHAADELRHASLFRGRAAELRAQAGVLRPEDDTARVYDLVRGRLAEGTNAHGFLRTALADEMGDVAYVAMLHVAEKRAAALFRRHARHLAADPETRGIFKAILKDEHYHVAYTGTLLQRWRKDGRATEVKRALSQARGSRFLGAWKRFGARSAGGFSRVVLVVMYFTLLAPFGLLSRTRKARRGWVRPLAPRADLPRFRSQYG